MLLKPTTYMNDSGQSVGEAMRFLKIDDADVYVFHDEIDLAPGKLKVKAGGGNAGHNGLRSISAHIGNDYNRVRIGVGHPGVKEAVAHYVLHDFAKAEHEWLEPMLDAIADGGGLAGEGRQRPLPDQRLARRARGGVGGGGAGTSSAKGGRQAQGARPLPASGGQSVPVRSPRT